MLPVWETILRLIIAAVLGSIIGAERERLAWAAGLRTHMLVSVGSCLFMIVSAFGFSDLAGVPNVVLDPSRVAAQVVSGIGFLGAGSILLRGEVIRGLTTAASLWTVAAVGLAVGGGLYIEAAAATIIVLGILAGVKPLEERYLNRRHNYEVKLHADHGKLTHDALNEALGPRARQVTRFISHTAKGGEHDNISIVLRRMTQEDVIDLVGRLESLPYVREVVKPPQTFK